MIQLRLIEFFAEQVLAYLGVNMLHRSKNAAPRVAAGVIVAQLHRFMAAGTGSGGDRSDGRCSSAGERNLNRRLAPRIKNLPGF